MTEWILSFSETMLSTLTDVLPIAAIIIGFQVLVIRKPVTHPKQLITGFLYVLLGIALFLEGLEMALFPLGELMAQQLTSPEFIQIDVSPDNVPWKAYFWVYIFCCQYRLCYYPCRTCFNCCRNQSTRKFLAEQFTH